MIALTPAEKRRNLGLAAVAVGSAVAAALVATVLTSGSEQRDDARRHEARNPVVRVVELTVGTEDPAPTSSVIPAAAR